MQISPNFYMPSPPYCSFSPWGFQVLTLGMNSKVNFEARNPPIWTDSMLTSPDGTGYHRRGSFCKIRKIVCRKFEIGVMN